MLVQFSVKNFRSLADQQTLSLVASSASEHRQTHIFDAGAAKAPELLRAAVIYGPNASGKSGFLLALAAMADLVTNSAGNTQVDEPLNLTRFAFAADQPNPITEFEAVIVEEGIRYQYGFTASQQRIESEWLLAFPEGRQQRWFERNASPQAGEPEWHFSTKLTGQKKTWQESTRPNALFLSTAVQLNSEQLKPVFQWFSNRLKLVQPYARFHSSFSANKCDDPAWKKQILDFLNQADLGISDITVERRQLDALPFPADMPEAVQAYFAKQVAGQTTSDVRFSHQTADGKTATFALGEESGGTQKAFALAGPWIDVLQNGYVLVIDELDTSLHPALMRHLFGMFHNPAINTKGAQLIFSTHDTTILDSELIRRDQVWFMEKDRNLRSHLYPLSDFSPRQGENLERGYLQGRYGALPFVGGLNI